MIIIFRLFRWYKTLIKWLLSPLTYVMKWMLMKYIQFCMVFISKLQRTIAQTVLALTTCGILFGIAIVIYSFMYYIYVPKSEIARPLYFSFKDFDLLTATLMFPNGKSEFHSTSTYKPIIELYLPESETNHHLGMFMLTLNYRTATNQLLESSTRSTSLHYRTKELNRIRTILFSLFFFTGWMSESQVVLVEMEDLVMNSYKELSYKHLEIMVSDPKLQIYEATIKFIAQLTGFRYFMSKWFLTSACLGILLVFLWELCFVSCTWMFCLTRRKILSSKTSGSSHVTPLKVSTPSSSSPRQQDHQDPSSILTGDNQEPIQVVELIREIDPLDSSPLSRTSTTRTS